MYNLTDIKTMYIMLTFFKYQYIIEIHHTVDVSTIHYIIMYLLVPIIIYVQASV